MDLDEATMAMRRGEKITHKDWIESEWIVIDQGEYYDENGEPFYLSPWMLDSLEFEIWEHKS